MTTKDKSRAPEKDAAEEKGINKQPSVLEWTLAVIGGALVVGVIGYMLYCGIVKNSAPPQFVFTHEIIQRGDRDFLVRFTIRNQGNQTAAQVNVEGVIKNGDASVETSAATLDYVPANSERAGGLLFTHDPRAAQFEIRAIGYQQP